MTVFALVFPLVLVVLLTAFLVAMPEIMPRGVPLGVAVPREHLGDDAVRGAVRRFRVAVLITGAISLVASIALALTAPIAGVIAPQLLCLVLGTGAYLVTRRGIVDAKRREGWYDDVPVRLTAEVTAPAHHRPPVLWPILGLVLLGVAAGIGIAAYPHLPDPYPVHFTAGGVVDRTAPRSVLAVFGPLLIGAAVAVVLAIVAVIVSRSALRVATGDADPLPAAARRRGVLAALLAELSAAIGGGFAVLSAVLWLLPGSRPAVIVAIALLIVAIFGSVIAATVRLAGISRAAASGPARRPESPDDDRHWKGGILYVDRQDPALWVPKRFGVGWTLNLGHPAGIAIGIVLLLVIAGAVVTAVLGIRAR
jgi:uncharacterized membrane protein